MSTGNLLSPQIGHTYIITTNAPATIIFKFIGIGEFEVNGEIIKKTSHTDLASPFGIINITEYHPPE